MSAECLKKARKTKRLDSSLSAKIGEDIYSQIEEIINGNK